jgi:glycosyltransferase involved in cell wall biosynthesis
MNITAVVPAYNAEWCIARAIRSLLDAGFDAADIIVADDASTDRTPEIAAAYGVTLVRLKTNSGAAAARNAGAAMARGDVIFFVDSDVAVLPDARARLEASFAPATAPDAVFGLYDDAPICAGTVGRFRNLLHHFVHLHGPDRPHSFWTGCGAVSTAMFRHLGGFDAGMRMMEDVEFGMRLTSAGGTIRIDRALRAHHLKSWSVRSMIRMDIFDRAIPWSRLLLFRHAMVNELNIDLRHRAGAIFAMLLCASLMMTVFDARWLFVSAAAFLAFVALNAEFHALALRRLGWLGGLAAIPLHVVHTLCAIVGFGWVYLTEFIPASVFNRPIGMAIPVIPSVRWRSPPDQGL